MPKLSLELSGKAAMQIMPRIDALAAISESPEFLCRRFGTLEHLRANQLVASWMQAADMQTRTDAVGNVIGRYAPLNNKSAPAIVLGSHLDTVINAGKYDGMLGVLSALAVVETLHEKQIRLPYALEIIGFADEEGVRYQATYLGSRAVAGTFDESVLTLKDDEGVMFQDALSLFGTSAKDIPSAARQADDILAYLELHIEQGPVLEARGQPVGVVSSIAGANRFHIVLGGLAGHAGTVPMELRHDAMAAAAQCIAVVEQHCQGHDGLVGTVGRIRAEPGVGNVIAGKVSFSVDIRAAQDELRVERVAGVLAAIEALCSERGVTVAIQRIHEVASVDCDTNVTQCMQSALKHNGCDAFTLPSGAGHDAAAMAELTDVGMLFVRCAGGISHHPGERVTEDDAIMGARVLLQTVLYLAERTP